MATRYLMMFWDCPHCGSDDLWGTYKCCPNCGKPKGDEIRDERRPAIEFEVTDEELIALAEEGADRNCRACDYPCASSANHCVNCGSGLNDARPRYRGELRQSAEDPGLGSEADYQPGDHGGLPADQDFDGDSSAQSESHWHRRGTSSQEPTRHWPVTTGSRRPHFRNRPTFTPLMKLATVCIAALVLLLMWFLFWPKTQTVWVSGHEWSRSVSVEEEVTNTYTGWKDNMPFGATVISEWTEQDGTKPVVVATRWIDPTPQVIAVPTSCDYKETGTGLLKETCTNPSTRTEDDPPYSENVMGTEPNMRQKVTYNVDEWETRETQPASGVGTNPYWPSTSYTGNNTRETRTEQYWVLVKWDGGKEKPVSMGKDMTRWQSYQQGQQVRVRTNRAGMVSIIE